MALTSAIVAGALGLGSGGLVGVALQPGSPEVVEGIPNRALVAYVNAAQASSCGVEWFDLAAIGVVESGHGTHGGAHIQADGTISQPIGSHAGAQGPMQFMDTYDIPTWTSYVRAGFGDGDGDGVANVDDVDDAARAAGEYLCRNGYVAGDRDAVVNAWGAYNGGANWRRYDESRSYVVQAEAYASAYSGAAVPAVATPLQHVAGAAAPPPVDRSFSTLARNVWRLTVGGWLRVGESENPAVRDAWAKADRELFKAEEAQ